VLPATAAAGAPTLHRPAAGASAQRETEAAATPTRHGPAAIASVCGARGVARSGLAAALNRFPRRKLKAWSCAAGDDAWCATSGPRLPRRPAASDPRSRRLTHASRSARAIAKSSPNTAAARAAWDIACVSPWARGAGRWRRGKGRERSQSNARRCWGCRHTESSASTARRRQESHKARGTDERLCAPDATSNAQLSAVAGKTPPLARPHTARSASSIGGDLGGAGPAAASPAAAGAGGTPATRLRPHRFTRHWRSWAASGNELCPGRGTGKGRARTTGFRPASASPLWRRAAPACRCSGSGEVPAAPLPPMGAQSDSAPPDTPHPFLARACSPWWRLGAGDCRDSVARNGAPARLPSPLNPSPGISGANSAPPARPSGPWQAGGLHATHLACPPSRCRAAKAVRPLARVHPRCRQPRPHRRGSAGPPPVEPPPPPPAAEPPLGR